MDATRTLNLASNLKLYSPDPGNFGVSQPTTPNEWFIQRYPDQFERFGSPFLELTQSLDQFAAQTICVSINHDFFASILGGRKDLGHHVIYFEADMHWYFKDSDRIYKPTTSEKLMTLYRALLMKCAQEMPHNVYKLNLFHELKTDKVAKTIVNRAKSILAADSSFFSATSPHQRIKGIELHERLARKYVEELLTAEPGQILMLHDAYNAFCRMLKERELEVIKRSDFKAMVIPMIRDEFNVSLRNDLVVDGKAGVRGWKNVRLNQALPA